MQREEDYSLQRQWRLLSQSNADLEMKVSCSVAPMPLMDNVRLECAGARQMLQIRHHFVVGMLGIYIHMPIL
jgi:hypothetical protein